MAAIALIDCQAFYCSCEQVFRPDLKGRPVIVLSNNDGCVVAANREAKALGVPMFAPVYPYEALIHRHGIAVFSSNYTLYGDMSRRVMTTLEGFSHQVERYSIDEAFLVAPSGEPDLAAYGERIRRTIAKHTGLPVRVGIGPTKALAKVAQRLAKRGDGLLVLDDPAAITRALETTPVEEIWGVGPAHAARLRAAGILTARQLRDADDHWIRSQLTVVGLRLVHELRGQASLGWELSPPPKQEICVSRAFGAYADTIEALGEAIATYTGQAAETLRRQRSLAGALTVFFHTNPFASHRQLQRSGTVELDVPSAATPELLAQARRALESLYAPGYRIKKAGVILGAIVPADREQGHLFDTRDRDRDRRLMRAVDALNRDRGTRVVRFAAEGLNPHWRTRFERRSPRYTTRIGELPEAACA